MSRRTNDFQTLIYLIERQLAPQGARVTESKLLRDSRGNEEREIDVAIETEVGGHPVIIGVECIDHRRSASVVWIDNLIGKYRNLPVHKVIAVSRSGLSKAALRKAVGANIETLSLNEAVAADWVDIVDRLKTITPESFLLPYPTRIQVIFAADSIPPDPSHFNLREDVLYRPEGISCGL